MNTENKENYKEKLGKLIEFYPLFESALQEGAMCDEVRDFLLEDLDNCYSTFQDLREEINHTSISKKRFASKKNTIF